MSPTPAYCLRAILALLLLAFTTPGLLAQGPIVLLAGELSDIQLASLHPGWTTKDGPIPTGALKIMAAEEDGAWSQDDDPASDSLWRTIRVAKKGSKLAQDLALMTWIADAPILWLEGGQLLDWWSIMTSNGRSKRLARAIHTAWRRGATLMGRGGAAAWLAGGSRQSRADMTRTERNPRKLGLTEIEISGSTYVSIHLEIDGQVTGCGRPGSYRELLEAALTGPFDEAVLLRGNVAWAVLPGARQALVIGDGTVVVTTRDDARMGRDSIRRARLSLLHHGDVWDSYRGRPIHASERTKRATPTVLESDLGFASDAKLTDLNYRISTDERSRWQLHAGGKSLYDLTLAIRRSKP
ncbi:MAG: hypothetical protein ACI841_001192 [Planctomycetota bacterium]|jgi:hypothetical protein